MAITAINIVQDNFVGDSNLVCVHNPLIFKVNTTYTGSPPEILNVDINDAEFTTLGTFKAIPYADVSGSVRQFIFIADSILRGYMGIFDDFQQSSGSLEIVENITKRFNISFYKFMEASVNIDIVAIHGVRQFSDNPNAIEVFNNESKTYIGAESMPVYAYFYNDDQDAVISITQGGGNINPYTDYDDTEFADFDDELLTGVTT